MSTKRTKCPDCDSYNIKSLNLGSKETSKQYLVTISAICLDCDKKFTYQSSTTFGKRKGIRY